MVAVRNWRYSSAVLATFVVALGNISLFLGVALAQERVSDECSIQNIEKYVAWIKSAYSSELVDKFRKCSAVAVPWLIEQTKVNNADTQVTAISLLAMIGTPASSAAPRLIELLQRSQNEDLRILAVGALPKVASSENLKSVISVLGSTLQDEKQDVRFGSAISLVALYKNGNKLSLSSDTTNALRQIINEDVVPALILALQDKESNVRSAAAYALRGIGKDAVPALILALQDKESNVRFAAAYVLEVIGKDAVPALILVLKDRGSNVRSAAAYALRGIGKDAKDAVPALILALQDKESYVRYDAAIALEVIGKNAKDAVPALILALQDKESYVRSAAAYALIGIGKDAKDAVPALTSALQNNDKDVRTAANSLGAIGKDAIPTLTSALQDKDKDVRIASVEALGEIGKDAIPALTSALQDKDKDVRNAATNSLEKINSNIVNARPFKRSLDYSSNNRDWGNRDWVNSNIVNARPIIRSWAYSSNNNEHLGGDNWVNVEKLRDITENNNRKNKPKMCESSLAAILTGWKCTRK